MEQHHTLARGTTANAPYVSRPPSPPYIHVPSINFDGGCLSLVPSYQDVDTTQLTEEDLEIITQNKIQIASDAAGSWKYESRRLAQPVLDFLYLGPSSVARDAGFLRAHGITMLIAARDSRMASARLMSVDRTAQALGIVCDYIDVAGHQELIRAFPTAVQKINDHLLHVYRSQAMPSSAAAAATASGDGSSIESPSQPGQGQMVIDNSQFRRGKVLVFCETGNDRSAAIVAAYIMSIFGMDLIKTLQFVGLQRFCVNFDEETKNWLKSYEDILTAKRMVWRGLDRQAAAGIATAHPAAEGAALSSGTALRPLVANAPRPKRRIEETMETEDVRMEAPAAGTATASFNLDMDRYTDRPAFIPFTDGDMPMGM